MFDPMTISVPDHIENPGAYRAAVARKIQARIAESRRAKARIKLAEWLANPDNMQLMVALTEEMNKPHPNSFLSKMHYSLLEWGSLTEGQDRAARKVILDREAKARERAVENAAAAERSDYVGKEGERSVFDLKLTRRWSMDGYFGPCIGHILEDASGNIFVYIGQKLDLEIGDERPIRATVKGHDVRDGVKQTKLSRPKVEMARVSQEQFLANRSYVSGTKAIKL